MRLTHSKDKGWQEVAAFLSDPVLMAQAALVAEFGERLLTPLFLWAECGGGYHAFRMHRKLMATVAQLWRFRAAAADSFPVTFEVGTGLGLEVGQVEDMVQRFVAAFSGGWVCSLSAVHGIWLGHDNLRIAGAPLASGWQGQTADRKQPCIPAPCRVLCAPLQVLV